ncbi:restriction endonuclease subunit S [Lachnoclostridium sp. MSJ-17]|uniref:restriction endonuclease subunit S n=1 Tax=Lachnoclostridium sp. MSJ-17 TaxID=2841516 RepID=UPI001C11EBA1|nr:restriction endonuclease subunit S [Lachnoclostridium sp. MSJ-17]MBU5461997.1 restriction endonuclease subunit S [Lachnoclostridium sp. MSJ-17]
MNNTPAVRFKGFTEDWEQRKLSEMTAYRNGRGHEDKQSNSGKYELINLNSVSIDGGLKPSGKFIDESNDTLCVDDLVMVLSDVGHGDLLGRVAIIPENNRFVLNQRVALLRPNDSVYSRFLLVCINAHQSYFKLNGAGSSQLNISKDVVEDFAPHTPEITEQKLIAHYYSNIDYLITLHQRKYEKLVNIKKSMLYKMFPQNGSKVPEIRFAGFTGDWEQRKLGDLAIFNPKEELPNVFEYVDLESVVGTEMLTHRTESKRTAPSRAQRLAQAGDLFYQTVRPYQKNNYLFEKPDKHYVFSTGYAQMRPIVDGRFLLCLVQNDSFVKVVLDNCTGTSYPAINSNDLAEIEVYSSSNPQEQKQIGDFFKEIDDLITLHQRKLEKLKQLKKAMLHKMFV